MLPSALVMDASFCSAFLVPWLGKAVVLLAAGGWMVVLVTVLPTLFHFYVLNLFYLLNEAAPSLSMRMIVTALESHFGRADLLTSLGARG